MIKWSIILVVSILLAQGLLPIKAGAQDSTDERQEVLNEGLFVAFLFLSGTTSLIFTPFVTLAFLARRPMKEFTTLQEIPLEVSGSIFWSGGYGISKIVGGGIVLGIYAILPFLIISDIFPVLIYFLLTGFLFFGVYLIIKSLIEGLSNARLKTIPIFLLSSISILIGFYGFNVLQNRFEGLINPNAVGPIILVQILYYSLSLAPFIGLMLIYEGLYRTRWSHYKESRLFLIDRSNIVSSSKEYFPEKDLEQISLDLRKYTNQFGPGSTAILKLTPNEQSKHKTQAWFVRNESSYFRLVNSVNYLCNNNLLKDWETNLAVKLITEKSVNPQVDRNREIYIKYPELAKNLPSREKLENHLKSAGFSITKDTEKSIELIHPKFRNLFSRGYLLNGAFLLALSLSWLYFFIRFIGIVSFGGLSSIDRFLIYLVVFSAVFALLSVGFTLSHLKRIPMLLKTGSLVLNISKDVVKIRINERETTYPASIISGAEYKRDLLFGAKICSDKAVGNFALLFLSNKELAKNLTLYLSIVEARYFS